MESGAAGLRRVADTPRRRGKRQAVPLIQAVGFVGSPTRARTWDLRINSPSLYQLSYRGSERKVAILTETPRSPQRCCGSRPLIRGPTADYAITFAIASATYLTLPEFSAATQMRPVSMA